MIFWQTNGLVVWCCDWLVHSSYSRLLFQKKLLLHCIQGCYLTKINTCKLKAQYYFPGNKWITDLITVNSWFEFISSILNIISFLSHLLYNYRHYSKAHLFVPCLLHVDQTFWQHFHSQERLLLQQGNTFLHISNTLDHCHQRCHNQFHQDHKHHRRIL